MIIHTLVWIKLSFCFYEKLFIQFPIVNYAKILSCVGFLIDDQKHTFCKFPSKEHFSQDVFLMFQWFEERVISKSFSVGSYV